MRVTPKEYEDLKSAADDQELTLTDFLRILIFKRMPKHRAKKIQLVDPVIGSELSRAMGLFKSLYTDYGRSGHFDSDRSAELLREIGALLRKIDRCLDRFLETIGCDHNDREKDPKER